jgi:hypothetical protein
MRVGSTLLPQVGEEAGVAPEAVAGEEASAPRRDGGRVFGIVDSFSHSGMDSMKPGQSQGDCSSIAECQARLVPALDELAKQISTPGTELNRLVTLGK